MYKVKKSIVPIALVMLVIAGLILTYELNIFKMTLISQSQTNIKIEGGQEDSSGRYVKGYWVLTFTVDQYEEYMGYLDLKLPKNTTGVTADGKKVYTNADVIIRLTPGQAKITRPVKMETIMVAPKTYRGWSYKIDSVCKWDEGVYADAVYAYPYTWAGDAEYDTTWKAEIIVNGKSVGTAQIDTEQGTYDIVVKTDKGDVIVKHLGALQGKYIPTFYDVLIFSQAYIFRYSDAYRYIPYDSGAVFDYYGAPYFGWGECMKIRAGTSDAYSVYWYGDVRWKDDKPSQIAKTPAPWWTDWWGFNMRGEGLGWKAADDFWAYKRDPVAPVIFPEDKTDWHKKYQWGSLIEYIEGKGAVNLASSLFPNAQSWSLDTANRRVVINLPWNAYTIPMGVIYVPTELADTWVYYPPKANVKITSVAWETGESIRQISGTAVALVNVVQKARVKSSFRITAFASVPTAKVSPAEQTFTLEPNATMTVRFNVQNLGVQADTDGYITFVVYETWTGTETDRNSNLRFKLLAASTTTTILDVLCVDKETGLAVSGIIVYVSYGSGESKNGITGANGMATFSLGNYRGQATISTLPTDVYKQSTLSVTVSGKSSATLYLEKQGKGGGWEDWWTYVLIGIVIVMAVVLAFVVSKKRSKMRRR